MTHIDTTCVQGGYQPGNGESRTPPIIQATTFKYTSSEQMSRLFDLSESGYFYTRRRATASPAPRRSSRPRRSSTRPASR